MLLGELHVNDEQLLVGYIPYEVTVRVKNDTATVSATVMVPVTVTVRFFELLLLLHSPATS